MCLRLNDDVIVTENRQASSEPIAAMVGPSYGRQPSDKATIEMATEPKESCTGTT